MLLPSCPPNLLCSHPQGFLPYCLQLLRQLSASVPALGSCQLVPLPPDSTLLLLFRGQLVAKVKDKIRQGSTAHLSDALFLHHLQQVQTPRGGRQGRLEGSVLIWGQEMLKAPRFEVLGGEDKG